MTKKIRVGIILMFVLGILFGEKGAAAQVEEDFTVSLSRDFGYGGFAGDIEGLFTIRASGPEALVRVIFYIDEQVMLDDSSAPYSYQFRTGNYSLGAHELYAVGYLENGEEITSNKLSRTFVSPEVGTETAAKIVIPLLALVVVFMLGSFLLPFMLDRKKAPLPLGAPRQYGAMGGAICPKCSRPFSIRLLSINVSFVGKFDRCPHCGKWSLVRRASAVDLAAAERAELENGAQSPGITEASRSERMQREIEDSRYSE